VICEFAYSLLDSLFGIEKKDPVRLKGLRKTSEDMDGAEAEVQ
jgi:hypothetical protein